MQQPVVLATPSCCSSPGHIITCSGKMRVGNVGLSSGIDVLLERKFQFLCKAGGGFYVPQVDPSHRGVCVSKRIKMGWSTSLAKQTLALELLQHLCKS